MILKSYLRKAQYLPVQDPDIHIIPFPVQDASMPHLQNPFSQLSDVSPEHDGLTPHLHVFDVQVSDKSVQS